VDSKHLRDVPLFAGLGKRDMQAVAELADEVDAKEGEVLTRQGDLGHEFFVVERGRAEVTIDGEKVNELGPGDFFGEIALIAEERRTATVTALEPMTLIVLSGQGFRALKRQQPEVYATVEAAVAERHPTAAG